MSLQNECKRCGICCENGGPALHTEDLELIHSKGLSIDDLVTIRKGEMIHNPVSNAIEPVSTEFLKIKGSKGSWACRFYDKKRGCTIYTHRPLGCRTLKCWDTFEILNLAGKDLISRMDVMAKEDPLRERITTHETLFPLPDLDKISRTITRSSKNTIKKLEKLCNKELSHRMESVQWFHLSVDRELFYFGRPMFELLVPLGFDIIEKGSTIKLRLNR